MKNLSLFLLAMALIFVSSQAEAFTSIPIRNVDQAVAMVGQNGFVLQGKVTKVEKSRLDNGWSAVACTFEGDVLKGNEVCPAKDGTQTCTVKMVDTVRGLNICKEGMEGVFCVYGVGKFGGTSFTANGDCNTYFEAGPDGSKQVSAKRFQFKNKSLESKMMKSLPPAVSKSLGLNGSVTATTTAAPGTLSADQVGTVYRSMIQEMYSTNNQ